MDVESSCPYCGERISLWVDPSGSGTQSYIEDCSVCCHPCAVRVTVDDEGYWSVTVLRDDD